MPLVLFAGGYIAAALTPHWRAWWWMAGLVAVLGAIATLSAMSATLKTALLLVMAAYTMPVVGGLVAGLTARTLTLWRSDLCVGVQLAIMTAGFVVTATIAWVVLR